MSAEVVTLNSAKRYKTFCSVVSYGGTTWDSEPKPTDKFKGSKFKKTLRFAEMTEFIKG